MSSPQSSKTGQIYRFGMIFIVYSGWSIKARERGECSTTKFFGITSIENDYPEARSV